MPPEGGPPEDEEAQGNRSEKKCLPLGRPNPYKSNPDIVGE